MNTGEKRFYEGLLERLLRERAPGDDVVGYHYSRAEEPLRRLSGDAHGTGARGQEAARLADAPDIRPRSYFYTEGASPQPGYQTPRPEGGINGRAVYRTELSDVYDLDADPLGLRREGVSPNDFERLIKDLGFKGYQSKGTMIALQDSTEVQRLGPFRAEVEERLRRAQNLPDAPHYVTAENIPSASTDMGAWLNGQPMSQRERYHDSVEDIFERSNLNRLLGIEAVDRPGYGGYEGGINPNTVSLTGDEDSALKLAKARGYVTQQDAVPIYSNNGGDTMGVRATLSDTVSPQLLEDMQRTTGLDMTRSDSNQIDFLNFLDERGQPLSGMDDERFIESVSDYVAGLPQGRGQEPLAATASYNGTKNLWDGLTAAPSGENAVPGKGRELDELRARLERHNEAYRKQHGVADPRLLALLGTGGLAAAYSEDAEGASLPTGKLLKLTGGPDMDKALSPHHERLLADPKRRALAEEGGFNVEQPYYHATRAGFTEFDPEFGDIGTHIGTRNQATNRVAQTADDDSYYGANYARPDTEFDPQDKLIPLVTRAGQNSLAMPDVGNWNDSLSVIYRVPLEGQQWDDLLNHIDDTYNSYGMEHDAWVASEENKGFLNEINRMLQEEGYDSITYNNQVETSPGAMQIPQRSMNNLRKEIRRLEQEGMQLGIRRPDAPRLDDFGGDPEKLAAAVEEWLDWKPPGPDALPPEYQRKVDKLQQRLTGFTSRAKEYQYPESSMIVLNTEDMRHPDARFDPNYRDSSHLLRSAAPVAGGGLLAAMALTPEDVQAAGMETGLKGAGGAVEDFARGTLGAGIDLATGDRSASEGVRESVIPDSGINWSLLFDPTMDFLGESLRDAADYAEPTARKVMDNGGGALIDSAIEGYKNLDPKTQTRIGGAAELAFNLWDAIPVLGAAALPAKKFLGGLLDEAVDPRYFSRVTEKRAAGEGGINLPHLEVEARDVEVPEVSLADFEGRPFVTSFSDRSAHGGTITGVDGRELPVPVDLQGGQGFMFENPGLVWASDRRPAQGIMNEAARVKEATGQDPLFLPWRMAPTGVDHATMSGDLLISNAMGTLNKKQRAAADKAIRELTINGRPAGIPDWPGMDDPEAAMAAWANATGSQRKAIKDKVFDTQLRGDTGLSQPQARLAVTDADQVNVEDMTLQNVGLIDTAAGLQPSPHRTYGAGIPGKGIGTLKEKNVHLYDLFPWLLDKGDPYRSAGMRPLSGTFTSGLLDVLSR